MKLTEVAKLDRPASIRAFDTIQSSRRPLLFPEVVSTWPARERWNIKYFESAEGSASIPIGLYPNGNYFEPCVVIGSTMRDYCEWLRNPPRREKYYLAEVEINKSLPKLAADIQAPAFIDASRILFTALFIGCDSITGLHIHPSQQALLCQVVGQKRVSLFPPCDFKHLHFNPWYHYRYNFSKLNFDYNSLLPEQYPGLPHIHPIVCTLNPGDALYIPKHWAHFVHGRDLNASVTFFWKPQNRDLACGLVGWHSWLGLTFKRTISRPLTRFVHANGVPWK